MALAGQPNGPALQHRYGSRLHRGEGRGHCRGWEEGSSSLMALGKRRGAAPWWSSVLLATHHPQLCTKNQQASCAQSPCGS